MSELNKEVSEEKFTKRPKRVAKKKVCVFCADKSKVIDYKEGVEGLPSADVLRFELSDDTTLFIRPSGTEPKIKGYIMVKTPTNSESEEKLKLYKEELNKLFD